MRGFVVACGSALIVLASCGRTVSTMEPEPGLIVPSDFVKFEDDASTFSLYYPEDWYYESDSELASREREYLNSLGDSTSVDFDYMFKADRGAGQGAPVVNVIVQQKPREITLQELAAEGVDAWAADPRNTLRSERVVTIGNNRAHLIDVEYETITTFGAVVRLRAISLVTKAQSGKAAWYVTCVSGAPSFDDPAKICESVVRSFRLLR